MKFKRLKVYTERFEKCFKKKLICVNSIYKELQISLGDILKR
jgi:hypothetical protein